MSVTQIGIPLFIFYLMMMTVIGFLASRHQRSSTDFWVAGRQIGLPLLIVANLAAIMHGGSILSGIGIIGKFGAIAGLPFLSFACGIAVIFFVFAKKLRNSNGFTIPDYMGERFDSTFLRGFSALIIAISSIIYLIAQIRVMGFILERLLGIPFFWGMLIGTFIFVFYVAIGGLLAIIWTNIAQFTLMWLGLILMGPYVYRRAGGWYDVIEKVEAIAPGWTSVQGTEWSVTYLISWYLIWFIAYCTRIELITKVYAAKNAAVARHALPWTMLFVALFLLYSNVYLGAAARILIWDNITTPDQAFTTLVTMLLPPILAAFALTGVASAAMSTTDSLLLVSGASISHDLLRKCLHEPRGIYKSDSYYLQISKITIIGMGCLSFLGAIPDIGLVLRIVSFSIAFLGSAFFFPLLLGLTTKRISKVAAIASSVGGTITCTAWIYLQASNISWTMEVHPGVAGLVIAGFIMIAVATITEPLIGPPVDKFFPKERII